GPRRWPPGHGATAPPRAGPRRRGRWRGAVRAAAGRVRCAWPRATPPPAGRRQGGRAPRPDIDLPPAAARPEATAPAPVPPAPRTPTDAAGPAPLLRRAPAAAPWPDSGGRGSG